MFMAEVTLTTSIIEEFLSDPARYFHLIQRHSGFCSSELFILFLTVARSVIPIRVLELDLVASVKLRIQKDHTSTNSTPSGRLAKKKKKNKKKKQKLVSGEREFSQNVFGIEGENVLELVLRLYDLQTILVRNSSGKEFEFSIERFRNVAYLKQQIATRGEVPFSLEHHELFYNGEKLDEDYRLIDEISSNGDNVIELLVKDSAEVRAEPVEKDFQVTVEESNLKGRRNEVEEGEGRAKETQYIAREPSNFHCLELQGTFFDNEINLPLFAKDLMSTTLEGLQKGHSPVLAIEGMGGTYLMPHFSGHRYVSVFKPLDEEPMATNNPRGLPISTNGEGFKRGTKVGEGALREAAAYGLDHPRFGPRFLHRQEKGFAGVPVSLVVQCLHEGFNHPQGYEGTAKDIKIGSLHKFVENCGSCEDMGPSAFPVEEVHKISVLDIRLANADRHAGNILVSYGEDGKIILIPIDHGYCLPDNFEDCTFEWLYWPQSHQPFSPDTVDYIQTLDAEDDIKQIALFGWDLSPQCAQVFRISTMLLKKGAERGLTPHAIGSIMCRETSNKESTIEEIVREAQDFVLPGSSEDAFIKTVSQIMDLRIDKLMK